MGGLIAAYNGPLTPEMQAKLRRVKACVLLLWFSDIGRMCTSEFPTSDIISAIVGVFLLKSDDTFQTCFACLSSSPLAQCAGPSGGGLSCLLPFMFIAGFNATFELLQISTSGPFIVTSILAQGLGSYFALKLLRLVSAAVASDMGSSGQAQPLTQRLAAFPGGAPAQLSGGSNFGPGGGAASGNAADAAVQDNFRAFQGSGQRLGG